MCAFNGNEVTRTRKKDDQNQPPISEITFYLFSLTQSIKLQQKSVEVNEIEGKVKSIEVFIFF